MGEEGVGTGDLMIGQQRYVSRELTHFVGQGKCEGQRYALLIKILKEGWLTHPPHNIYYGGGLPNLPMNFDGSLCNNDMYNPQIICFCDIPLMDLQIHIKKYSSFGISFLKQFLINKGANPVYYVAKNSKRLNKDIGFPDGYLDETLESSYNPRFEITRCEHFDDIVKIYNEFDKKLTTNSLYEASDISNFIEIKFFLENYIFSFVKFFDDSLKDEDLDNYYMEREWRVLGNVSFSLKDVCRIILPRSYGEKLRKDVPDYCGQVYFID